MPTKYPTKAQIRKQIRDERREAKRRMLELAKPHPRRVRSKYNADLDNGDGFHRKPVRRDTITLSDRMLWMCQPKYQNKKYNPNDRRKPVKCTCFRKASALSMRLEHLSLPLVRTLIPSKKELKPILSKRHFNNIELQLSKSLHTIYSKIYHIAPPKPPKKKSCCSSSADKRKEKEKLEKEKRIQEWCIKHAKPKKYDSEEILRLNEYTSLTEEDFYRLATPKYTTKPFDQRKPVKISDPIVPISKAALEFEPTPNIIKMSTPKVQPEEEEFEPYQNPYDIPREYRKVKTAGYKELANPKNPRKRFQKGDNKSETFDVSPNALKYKLSEETKKLSAPKADRSEPPRPGFVVSKAALKKLKPDKEEYYAKLATPRKL